MSDFYRFPAMAKLDDFTIQDQFSKIKDETTEAINACGDYGFRQLDTGYDSPEAQRARKKYGMELMDIIHATETALRMEFSDEEIERFREDVIEKNRRRGYYGE